MNLNTTLLNKLLVANQVVKTLLNNLAEIEINTTESISTKITKIKKIRDEITKVAQEIDIIKQEITLLRTYQIN